MSNKEKTVLTENERNVFSIRLAFLRKSITDKRTRLTDLKNKANTAFLKNALEDVFNDIEKELTVMEIELSDLENEICVLKH